MDNSSAHRSNKRQDIELLRVISALGVVWFHSGAAGKFFAYSGLIVFLLLSLYFAAQSTSGPKSVIYRANRLLIPWLVWFVFYGVLNLVLHRPFVYLENGIILGILAGTSIHLWYMPFIFFALIAFDWIKKRFSPQLIGYSSAVLAIIVFASAYLWRPFSLEAGVPYAQYAHAWAGVLIGLFLAYYFDLEKNARASLLLAILALTLYLTILPMPGVGATYLVAISISAIVLLFSRYRSEKVSITWLSECTLGIYLIHPFILKIISYVHFVGGVGRPLVAFLISAISVLLFKRFAPSLSRFAV